MNQRDHRELEQNQGADRRHGVKFTIQRDGTLTDVEVDQSSRNPLLDLESQRAS